MPYIFHITGMCSYNPLAKQNASTSAISMYQRLPAICLFLLISLATVVIFIYQYKEYLLHSEVIINIPVVGFIWISYCTCLTIVSKSLIASQSIDRIWHHLGQIETLHNLHFSRTIDFCVFYRHYLLDILLATFCHVLHFVVHGIFNYGLYDFIVKMLSLWLYTVILQAMFHALFYVRLLVFMMTELNKHILNDNNSIVMRIFCTNALEQHTLIKNFKFVKQMHYLLYDISVMINQYFGWILVATFMTQVYDSVNMSFWFIWYMERNSSALLEKAKLLSKYDYFVCRM